jgi:hypothetical protein
MLTRAVLPARKVKAAGIRLNKDKREAMIARLARIMRRAEPTAFALESELRHRLRSKLCLEGTDYILADLLAADIVDCALRSIGAQRPSWKEGQPEWTQEGVVYIARTRCVRCHWKLPEGHYRYCSNVCASAHLMRMKYLQDGELARADRAAREAEWRAAQPKRACEVCGDHFQPNRPGHRFCSFRCRNVHNGGLGREP